VEENKEGECKKTQMESTAPPLFPLKRPRTLWYSAIRLIAPGDKNGRHWSSSDAVGAWCIK